MLQRLGWWALAFFVVLTLGCWEKKVNQGRQDSNKPNLQNNGQSPAKADVVQ